MIMGVDIAAGGSDDTAIAVFEHVGAERKLRFHTMLSERDLDEAGVGGKPENPSDMAAYINFLADNMGVDKVYLDKTGVGEGFNNEVNKVLGRRAQGFDFDDKEKIAEMMGDFNYALHNDLITLVPDPEQNLGAQLKAIVKEKNHRTSKPKFSGKDNAPNGKDDLAMALVLAAYPPNFDAEKNTTPKQRKNVSGYEDKQPKSTEGSRSESVDAIISGNNQQKREATESAIMSKQVQSSSIAARRNYNRRHSR